VKQGWRPKRTVLFAIWDAEEFGLIGSTEWAEKHGEELDKKLVAYLNADMNGKGTFEIQGSHTLEAFMAAVLRDVKEPEGSKTLLEAFAPPKGDSVPEFHISPMGSGSDYTAFMHHLGVSSLNMGFNADETRGIYHSIYDSFTWYSHFSDTNYTRGRALSQVMETALMRLADAPLLPFEFRNFARTVGVYLDELSKLKGTDALHLEPARKELERVRKTAEAYETRYHHSLEKTSTAAADRLTAANELLFRTERSMLLSAGLPGRDWFKHQIYAPGFYTGYGVKTLPAVRESIEQKDWKLAEEQIVKVGKVLENAGEAIQGATTELERAAK